MQIEQTDIPGIWRLSYKREHRAGNALSFLETSLLRHRPSSALPISWFPEQDGILLFKPDTSGLTPLLEAVPTMPDQADIGFLLLRNIMEAIDEAHDHLLTVDPSMLSPELIFAGPCTRESEVPPVHLICLPISDSVCEGKAVSSNLIDFFATAFHWDTTITDSFRALFEKRAYHDLLLDLRYKSGQSRLESQKTEQTDAEHKRRHYKDVSSNQYQKPKSSLIFRFFAPFAKIRQSIFRQDGSDYVHETTEELDLACDQFRIAQLSEGLPGTPDEELGQHAYILTEEFLIGRDMRDTGLWIDSSSVSRQHARITRKAGSYFVEDLGSRNGTTLDGIRLNRNREYLLPHKCRLAFAGEIFYFRSD